MQIFKPTITIPMELDHAEIDTIEKTKSIIYDLEQALKNNDCTDIICSDYDCDNVVTLTGLNDAYTILDRLTNAYEIC